MPIGFIYHTDTRFVQFIHQAYVIIPSLETKIVQLQSDKLYGHVHRCQLQLGIVRKHQPATLDGCGKFWGKITFVKNKNWVYKTILIVRRNCISRNQHNYYINFTDRKYCRFIACMVLTILFNCLQDSFENFINKRPNKPAELIGLW